MKKEIIIGIILLSIAFNFYFVNAESAEVLFRTGPIICEMITDNVLNTSFTRWVNTTSLTVENAMNRCDKYYNEIGYTCCPTGIHCNSTGSCEQNPRILGCSSYLTERECREDDLGIALTFTGNPDCFLPEVYYNLSGGVDCRNKTVCACNWESGACSHREGVVVNCSDGSTVFSGWCDRKLSNILNGNCSNLNMPITVRYMANWTGTVASRPVNCTNVSRDFACPSTASLPFFTPFNFFFSVLSITLVYMFIKRK